MNKIIFKKWSEEEVNNLREATESGKTINEIMEVTPEHSIGAIMAKIEALGYECYYDKKNGPFHFNGSNNHQEEGCDIHFTPAKKVETMVKIDTDTIAELEEDIENVQSMTKIFKESFASTENVLGVLKECFDELEKTKNSLWQL